MSFPYHRYISRIVRQPWAIHPDKADIIASLIAERAAGYRPSAEEIAERLGHQAKTTPAIAGADYIARGAAEGSPASSSSAQRIVVMAIHGTIAHRADSFEMSSGGASSEWIARQARRLAADATVRAVVLDIDSYGGSTEGLEVAGDAIYALRQAKPVIAVSNSNMASAGYWLGSQAHEIVVEPGGSVGSVGVIMIAPDFSAALEKEGIKVHVIRFGENKVEGNPFEPMSDETLAHFQSEVDSIGAKFHAAIARGREIDAATVKAKYGDGRYFLADQAKAVGLVDGIATLDQVVARLAKSTRVMRRASAAESFGCTCTISCQCQDGNREWCDADCEACKDGCACKQRLAQRAGHASATAAATALALELEAI